MSAIPEPGRESQQRPRVLIVDDEQPQMRALCDTLGAEGCLRDRRHCNGWQSTASTCS